jgi:hypothetical protein
MRECALYWVATPMRRIPELIALESAKSMMRALPPKKNRGLGAPFGQFCKPRATPARQHIGHRVTRQWLSTRICHPVSPLLQQSIFIVHTPA